VNEENPGYLVVGNQIKLQSLLNDIKKFIIDPARFVSKIPQVG